MIFPGIPVTSTNKADRHDIPDIYLKMALNTRTIYRCDNSYQIILFISGYSRSSQLWYTDIDRDWSNVVWNKKVDILLSALGSFIVEKSRDKIT